MADRTNSSEYFWSYEYYWDYIDPIPVDGSKLKVNKYSIVIAFWVGLAAFVTFLFLILLCMSCPGSTPAKGSIQGFWAPCWLQTDFLQQVIVGSQIEESSSNGQQPHCDDLRSSYSDVVP